MTVLVSDDDVSQSQCSQVWRAELLTKCTFTIDSCSKITSNNRHCIAARDSIGRLAVMKACLQKKV